MLLAQPMIPQETINLIALSKTRGINLVNAKTLVDMFGPIPDLSEMRRELTKRIPDASTRLINALQQVERYLDDAKREAEYAERSGIKVLDIHDEDYPSRLRLCEDAPLVLYYYGQANFNRRRVINIIGTRRCSNYGRELCEHFVSELKRLCPDVLIVSGLAYGIDVCAHKAALDHGMDTVGVLAHGLDTIYPAVHRDIAVQMVRKGGGLLTEYMHGTTPEKMNFVRRNRIVAGISDACIVVESGAKGGSLITADMSKSYDREVFAFPGRVFDMSSAGCNQLIASNCAALLTSPEDFVNDMGWNDTPITKPSAPAIQLELFDNLTDEERAIIASLRDVDKKHVNQISLETEIAYSRVGMLLFDLEMRGYVLALGGAMYSMAHVRPSSGETDL